MKQACPLCGKKFDYEKHGWTCPFCSAVVLDSTEKEIQKRIQQKKEIRKMMKQLPQYTTQPPKNKKIATTSIFVSFILIFIFGMNIAAVAPDLWRKSRLQQEQNISYPVEQVEMQQTLSVAPYTLCIQQAYLFSMDQVIPPKNGQYLAVSYSSAGKSVKNSIQRINDVAWPALREEATGMYLLPLHVSDISGSDSIRSLLIQQNIDSEFNREGKLIFLLPDTANLESLTFCVFAGEEKENNHSYGIDAVDIQYMYEVPLTLTEQSEETAS